MHTAMCVVGKNYRLQDIQLSKNPRRRCLRQLWRGRPRSRDLRVQMFRLALVACLDETSQQCESYGEAKSGGEYRARTGDLLVANQALSQLS